MVFWKDKDGCILSDTKENGTCTQNTFPICKFIVDGQKPTLNSASGGDSFINHYIYFALKTRLLPICLGERWNIFEGTSFAKIIGTNIAKDHAIEFPMRSKLFNFVT